MDAEEERRMLALKFAGDLIHNFVTAEQYIEAAKLFYDYLKGESK